MKSLLIGIVFIIYCLITLILACSVVGIVVLAAPSGDNNATWRWFDIGQNILNKL